MKKASSKIIIFILLAVFFWSGINFDFQNNNKSLVLQTNVAYAQTNDVTDVSSPNTAAHASSVGSGWSWSKGLGKLADLALGIVNGLTWFGPALAWLVGISTVLNAILYIVSGIFDAFLNLSISNIGPLVDASGINTAWTIIRDALNISFIFILLYISISMILGSFGPSKKSTVAGVVASALLINYSLFITRVIIDFGNILATAINNGPGGAFTSTYLMNGLQLQTWFTPDIAFASGQLNILILMGIQIIMVCVLIGTLFKGIFFMLGRLVALVALLALSPFGFIGWSIPWLKSKADEWWSTLINQVFLLPVFLFFLMMTSIMLKGAQNIIGLMNMSVIHGSESTALQPGQWIYFCLIIGMLHLSVKMTKQMSGKVGDIMDKIAKSAKIMAAAGVAIGASIVTGGAMAGPSAAFVGRMAGRGGPIGSAARGIQEVSRSRVGQSLQTNARLASNLVAQPGIRGDIARSVLKSTLGAVKTHTGIDIETAHRNIGNYQKNYDEYAGKQANKIGPANEQKQLEILENIDKNIAAQAKARAEHNNRTGIEAINNNSTLSAEQKKEQHKILEVKINNEAKNLEGDIADQMGVERDSNKRKQERDALRETILRKTEDRNAYLKKLSETSYRGKKAADMLRAKQGEYKKESLQDLLFKEIEEKIRKEKKEKDGGGEEEPKTKDGDKK